MEPPLPDELPEFLKHLMEKRDGPPRRSDDGDESQELCGPECDADQTEAIERRRLIRRKASDADHQ